MPFKFTEICKTLLCHSWPLLFMPLLLYGGQVFPLFLDSWGVWVVRAWLPAILAMVALVPYSQKQPGSAIALGLAILMALGFGGIITWHVGQRLIVPVLPRHIVHVPYFIEHVDWINLGHACASFLTGILLAVRLIQDLLQGKDKDQAHKTTHGSARLATLAEIRQMTSTSGIPLGLLPTPYQATDALKMVASIRKQKGGQLLFAKPAHTMVIAPSGAGKGVGYVVPTLLEYQGPVFVTDIKGENYAITARYRCSLGRKVVVFDPFRITGTDSVQINPLDMVQADSDTAVDKAGTLAQLMCPTNRHALPDMKHFTRHAASLIQCLILYVVCSSDYAEEERHLGSVYDLLSLGDQGLKQQLELLSMERSLASGTIANLASTYKGTADREFSGIANTARAQLQFIDSPVIRKSLKKTTFNLTEMVQGQTDFYLCIPPEYLDTQSFLIRLLASLTFTEIKKVRGWTSQHQLLMVIDEMPSLDYVPQFEDILVYGRGYGVIFMGFAQSLELIQSVYPKSYRTFLSSSTTIFFDATELQTSEYVSNKLGRSTIEQQSTNEGKSKQTSAHNSISEQEGLTRSDASRSLLTPDEVACLGSEVSIIFIRGQRPLFLKKPQYYAHKRWQNKFDANPLENWIQKPFKNLQDKEIDKNPARERLEDSFLNQDLPHFQKERASSTHPESSEAYSPIEVSSLNVALFPKEGHPRNHNEYNQYPYPLFPKTLKSLEVFDIKTRAKYERLLKIIWNEAARGHLYTQGTFSMCFAGTSCLGSSATISLYLREMLLKGIIGLLTTGTDYGVENCDEGYLCLPKMPILKRGAFNEDGDDVFEEAVPTHYYDYVTGHVKAINQE